MCFDVILKKITLIQFPFPVNISNKVNVQLQQINSVLYDLTAPTVEEVKQIVTCVSNNCCKLDPLRDVLLTVCIDLSFGTTTNIINVSLKTGIFPDDFKEVYEKTILQ